MRRWNKTNTMKLAIGLFILLDLTLLGINFWITNQVYEDATAINLAGRERMLSQRVTKVLLQLEENTTEQERHRLEQELRNSIGLFYTTLNAFAHSGMVTAGDGKPIYLNAASSASAQENIQKTQQLAKPLYEQLLPYLTDRDSHFPNHIIALARDYAIAHNLTVLAQMNALTSALEHESQQRTDMMRLLQSFIFILALINFMAIIRNMSNATQKAIATSQHFSELAMRDALTGLFNRRQFNEVLEQTIHSIDHASDGLALLMIDLDEFKPVNDVHGHDAGDEVLREIAHRLASQARSNDTVARLGGDEFAILCPNLTTKEKATQLCQRLSSSIQQPITLENASTVSVNASIGIAFYPDHANEIDDLLQAADKAMYQAKAMGRGRCVCEGKTDVSLTGAIKTVRLSE